MWTKYFAALLGSEKFLFSSIAFMNTFISHLVGHGGRPHSDISVTTVNTAAQPIPFVDEIKRNSIKNELSLSHHFKANSATVNYRVHMLNMKHFTLVDEIAGLGSLFKLTTC